MMLMTLDCTRMWTHAIKACALLPMLLAVPGCATVPLQQAGSLSSYDRLKPAGGGLLTKAYLSVDKPSVLAAKTVLIIPTSYSASAASAKLSARDRQLVANAVDRSVCIGLSDRFHIAQPPEAADLTVHITIASIVPTDETAAAVTKVLDVSKTVLTNTGVVDTSIPIPSVRVPIGLGGIALEGEAVGWTGQQAAMVWAKGANAIFGTTRVSPIGDAYELASSFGDDFSELLVSGEDPFRTKLPSLPSMHSLKSKFGGAPKEAACDAFGRRGVTDMLAGKLGLPPGWTDDGPRMSQQAVAADVSR